MTSPSTLREVADELGVHYMTVYRYVRLGLLDADKVGGTWQVSPEAIERFRDGSGSGPVEAGSSAPWVERLEGRLVDGDGPGAWNVVEAAMTSGSDARSVYLDMLSPAMVNIGSRWEVGELDIEVEHEATGIAMRIIGRLGPRFARRGRSCGGLIVGAPSGEFHGLTTAIVADLMRSYGWNVVDLGANTPAEAFVRAAGRVTDLRGVGISVTHPDHLDAVRESCTAVKASFPDVRVVVGGRAVRDAEHGRSLGADDRATGAEQMHALLQPADTRPMSDR